MATAWSRAAWLADRTPASRNRYVDFLRAASMLVVTVGHWLVAAPHFDARGVDRGPHPDGGSLDRLAHVDRAGHADLLHRRRICEWRELARRAQRRQIVRHLAREPLAPLGVAAAAAACRLGGDRRHRVRPGRPPRADPLRIAGCLHSDLVPCRVYRD